MNRDAKKQESPSFPVEELLVNIANGLATAQKELDQASFATQVRLQEEGLDRQFGLNANWYTIPELDFDLQLAFELDNKGKLGTKMANAEYQSRYGFNLKASSSLKTKIRSVPPPSGEGISILTKKEVIEIAGQLKTVVELHLESNNPYFVVHYQPMYRGPGLGYAGGYWCVILMDTLATGERTSRSVCVVDDASSSIIRHWDVNHWGEPDAGSASIKGVDFTYGEQVMTLIFVNSATEQTLDITAALDIRGVRYILENRPFYKFEELQLIPQIGKAGWNNIKALALD